MMPEITLNHSRQTVRLQESRATSESVSVGSPPLAVARSAVNILVRTIASDDRVKLPGAVVALVALPVPLTSLGQHLFRSKDHATATGAALAWLGLDDRRIDHRGLRSLSPNNSINLVTILN